MPAAAAVSLQESPKATSPRADVPDPSQDDVVAQGKTTSSSPPPLQEPHVNIPMDPTLQRTTSIEETGVQSSVPLTPEVDSPKAHVVALEGQTPSKAPITEVNNLLGLRRTKIYLEIL